MLKNIFKKKEKAITAEQDTLLREQYPANVEGSEEMKSSYLYTSPEISGWLSKDEQERSFLASLLFFNPSHSILDVGCGRADLYGYLQQKFANENITYKGIDYNANLLKIAKDKYTELDVENVDLLSASSDEKFDWVIGSAIFNLNTQEDMESYIQACIDKMYSKSNLGTIFNLAIDYPDAIAEEDKQYIMIHDAGLWLNYLIAKYKLVLCRTEYLQGEVTFFIFK